MKFEDFTKEERYTIAEYVYSYESDILISSDATELVKLMAKKEWINSSQASIINTKIENKKGFIAEEIMEILFHNVPDEEGKKIMDEYFGINVPDKA